MGTDYTVDSEGVLEGNRWNVLYTDKTLSHTHANFFKHGRQLGEATEATPSVRAIP